MEGLSGQGPIKPSDIIVMSKEEIDSIDKIIRECYVPSCCSALVTWTRMTSELGLDIDSVNINKLYGDIKHTYGLAGWKVKHEKDTFNHGIFTSLRFSWKVKKH